MDSRLRGNDIKNWSFIVRYGNKHERYRNDIGKYDNERGRSGNDIGKYDNERGRSGNDIKGVRDCHTLINQSLQ